MFKQRESTLEKVIWKDDGVVEITFDGGWEWNVNSKNFFKTRTNWKKIFVSGAKIKTWTIQATRVMGLEIWADDKWNAVWAAGNDFEKGSYNK